jgi:hypothetical protein
MAAVQETMNEDDFTPINKPINDHSSPVVSDNGSTMQLQPTL